MPLIPCEERRLKDARAAQRKRVNSASIVSCNRVCIMARRASIAETGEVDCWSNRLGLASKEETVIGQLLGFVVR